MKLKFSIFSYLQNNAESIFIILIFSYPFFSALNLYNDLPSLYFSSLKYFLIHLTLFLFLNKINIRLNIFKLIFIFNLLFILIYTWSEFKNIILLKFLFSYFFICLCIVFINFEQKKLNFNLISIILSLSIFFLLFSIYFTFEITDKSHILSSYFFDGFKSMRLGSKNLNPISLSIYCMVTIYFLQFSSIKYKNILQFALFFVAMITGSRGPFLAFFLALIIISLSFKIQFDRNLLLKGIVFSILCFFVNILFSWISVTFATSNILFADVLTRILNMFIINYTDHADTFRYQIINNLLLSSELIVPNYNISDGVLYHNIFIETFKLLPFLFLSLAITIGIVFCFFLNKNFQKKKNNIIIFFLIIFFLINSQVSGFLPREEFLFILISLIFSQNKEINLFEKNIKNLIDKKIKS